MKDLRREWKLHSNSRFSHDGKRQRHLLKQTRHSPTMIGLSSYPPSRMLSYSRSGARAFEKDHRMRERERELGEN